MNYYYMALFLILVLVAFLAGVRDYRKRAAWRRAMDADWTSGYEATILLLSAFPAEDILRMLDIIETKHKPDAFACGMRAALKGSK